jgi:hypothetical protein
MNEILTTINGDLPMKAVIFTGVLLWAGGVGNALAVCTGTTLSTNAINTAFKGNTVCVSDGAGGWSAQEYHQLGGALIDYKLGAGHAVDPTTQIGTWATISGTPGKINYSYTGDPTVYSNTVVRSGTTLANFTYCFDNGTTTIPAATVKTGQVGC